MGLRIAKKLSLPRALFCFLKEEQSGQHKSRTDGLRNNGAIELDYCISFSSIYDAVCYHDSIFLEQQSCHKEKSADRPGNKWRIQIDGDLMAGFAGLEFLGVCALRGARPTEIGTVF